MVAVGVVLQRYGPHMTTLDVNRMSDGTLDSTARALSAAIPPLGDLAIAAGAAPELVRRSTGRRVTNTSRVRKQTFNHLASKADRALLATGCLPLLSILADSGATVVASLDEALRKPFIDELVEMIDAIQHMKYVLILELDTRIVQRRDGIATSERWAAMVQPHLAEMNQLSLRITDQAKAFQHIGIRHKRLLAEQRLSWSSRQPLADQLFTLKLQIADSLDRLAGTALVASCQAGQLESAFDQASVRRFNAAMHSHADRAWDHRRLVSRDSHLRACTPADHPLAGDLRPKSALTLTRQQWQADYRRALQPLRQVVERARTCSEAATAARDILLGLDRPGSSVSAAITVDLGNGLGLEVQAGMALPGDQLRLSPLPRTAISVL